MPIFFLLLDSGVEVETVLFSPLETDDPSGSQTHPRRSVIRTPLNGPKLSVVKVISADVVVLGFVEGSLMDWRMKDNTLRKATRRHTGSIFSLDGNQVRRI